MVPEIISCGEGTISHPGHSEPLDMTFGAACDWGKLVGRQKTRLGAREGCVPDNRIHRYDSVACAGWWGLFCLPPQLLRRMQLVPKNARSACHSREGTVLVVVLVAVARTSTRPF